MKSDMAPLKGTISLYYYLPGNHVMVQKENYKFIVITQDLFNQLYYELDNNKAALKGDCMEYCIYHPNKPLNHYPYWFINAMEEGWITNEYDGEFIFLNENGETNMSPGSVVLRNFMGDLRYMEMDDFSKYYDLTGDWYYKYL